MRYKPRSCLQFLEILLIAAIVVLAVIQISSGLCRTIEGNETNPHEVDDGGTYQQPDGAYPYSSYIKSPDEMSAGPEGNYTTLNKDIKAMEAYIDVLVSGQSKAQNTPTQGPMGNKYFLDTGGTCTTADGDSVQRYVYINNVPDGTIPLLSGAMGTKFTQYEGLVPGILEDLGYLDPSALMSAFSTEETSCREITMPVRDNENVDATQSYYVADSDISTYDACWFDDFANPVTGDKCNE
jgi:hypothetical protein